MRQHLIGRTVAVFGGAMYAQFRMLKATDCLVLNEGTTAAQGASCFVNPLTALGMVETMRREGHGALVHTAAASNLGQMLVRLCRHDGIGLVNIVRSPAQAALLRELGAQHVCDSSQPDFIAQLTEAIAATGATLGFDAIGGGPLAGQILNAMESAAARRATAYSRYGTAVHKQVYLYGMLDPRPTEIERRAGMHWGVGGWLLFAFLGQLGCALPCSGCTSGCATRSPPPSPAATATRSRCTSCWTRRRSCATRSARPAEKFLVLPQR